MESAQGLLERALLLPGDVEILRAVFMMCPFLGAAAGYLIDGTVGATSGFVIPLGPVLMAWMFDAS